MKKIICALLVLAILLAGCSQKETKVEEPSKVEEPVKVEEPIKTEEPPKVVEPVRQLNIRDYLEKGYWRPISGGEENIYGIELVSPDGTDYVLAYCEITEEDIAKIEEFDFFAEDYDEQILSLVENRLIYKSLNGYIPDMAEVRAKYVGKTFSDMEKDGYDQCSLANGKNGFIYLEYSNGEYSYAVYPVGDYEALFDIPEDYVNLPIKQIDFCNFGNALTYAFK